MKKLNTGLFCIELMLILIAGPAIAQVEEFQAHPDYATVYLRSAQQLARRNFIFEIDGLEIGKTLHENEYIKVSLAPGFHNFKTFYVRSKKYPQPSALFDLDVEPGAVILLDCFAYKTRAFGMTTIPKEPIFQEWKNYCPEGDVAQFDGGQACIKPYHDTGQAEAQEQGLPMSACYLSDDRGVFANSNLIKADIDFVTSEEFEYSQAEKLNTVDAYQAFTNVYPRGANFNEANKAIARLQEEQAKLADENTLRSMIERDAALPLQVRNDKYMISLTNLLKQQDYSESLMYFRLLEDLNIELSPSFEYFWGEALVNTGDTKGGIEKLYAYISSAGQEGQYYIKALELVSAAENQ